MSSNSYQRQTFNPYDIGTYLNIQLPEKLYVQSSVDDPLFQLYCYKTSNLYLYLDQIKDSQPGYYIITKYFPDINVSESIPIFSLTLPGFADADSEQLLPDLFSFPQYFDQTWLILYIPEGVLDSPPKLYLNPAVSCTYPDLKSSYDVENSVNYKCTQLADFPSAYLYYSQEPNFYEYVISNHAFSDFSPILNGGLGTFLSFSDDGSEPLITTSFNNYDFYVYTADEQYISIKNILSDTIYYIVEQKTSTLEEDNSPESLTKKITELEARVIALETPTE